jgi:hypothetical protein
VEVRFMSVFLFHPTSLCRLAHQQWQVDAYNSRWYQVNTSNQSPYVIPTAVFPTPNQHDAAFRQRHTIDERFWALQYHKAPHRRGAKTESAPQGFSIPVDIFPRLIFGNVKHIPSIR